MGAESSEGETGGKNDNVLELFCDLFSVTSNKISSVVFLWWDWEHRKLEQELEVRIFALK